MSFVHLHGHSSFSFLEAIGLVQDIVARAVELEMSAIAITDYYGMYGVIRHYNAAKEAGIKPIIGVELGFVMDHTSNYTIDKIGNIVLIARNKTGYHNLMKLTSLANTIGLEGKAKIDIQQLEQYSDGLLIILWGNTSWIFTMQKHQEHHSKITEIIQMLCAAVGKEYVIAEITAQDYNHIPECQERNAYILQLAQDYGLQTIVANNFHYIYSSDKYARETALAIKDGKKLYDLDRRKPAGDFHIMTEQEIKTICRSNGFEDSQIQEWIENTAIVADMIDTQIDLGNTLFPNYDSPEDIVTLYTKYKDNLVEEG